MIPGIKSINTICLKINSFFTGTRYWLVPITTVLFVTSCTVQKKIDRSAHSLLFSDSSLAKAHLGINIYDLQSGKTLYDYQGDHYFIPASNLKLFTSYAALKFLGDSLAGLRYTNGLGSVVLYPTGDPSLLHPDFPQQPVIDFLKQQTQPMLVDGSNWKTTAFGAGWSWDDYNDYYMPERSALPVYGNVLHWVQEKDLQAGPEASAAFIYSIPDIDWKVRFTGDTSRHSFFVKRKPEENFYEVTEGRQDRGDQWVPFKTEGILAALELLQDSIGKALTPLPEPFRPATMTTLYSQPLDSVLRPMLHRSDNFFAEQLLLMVANERAGVFKEDLAIRALLSKELQQLPQAPSWVDGSGLSRYNLFSPRDFVFLLTKLQQEFGMERLKHLLPTGGQGTLKRYFAADSSYLFAKTGTLEGVVCISGYLYTKRKKLLAFSILVNNHRGTSTAVRRMTENFLHRLREKY